MRPSGPTRSPGRGWRGPGPGGPGSLLAADSRAKSRAQILLVPMASCAHVPPPKCHDSDLRRPMAWFHGVYVLRALSWTYLRVWGAAGRGCHMPASPGSAHFAHSSYVNRALVGISTFGFHMERSARAEFGESACTGVACRVDAGAQGLRARFACASRAANDEIRCAHL
jgi:hypothetical protein